LFSGVSVKSRAIKIGSCVSSLPPRSAEQLLNMKQITISICCLSLFTLSALAQDTPAADNTSKNQRDRSGETRTSGDQSNSPEDVQITATIRRAVVQDHSLSATAKNVKIITADGVVTLRGPVQNEAEKTKIAELAQAAAGNAKIDNQLEVKASK
jgi:hyperosmotically inducible protein